MEIIPTAEELFIKYGHHDGTLPQWVKNLMISFAKLHVEAALKAASENANMLVTIKSGYLGNTTELLKEISYHDNCGGSRYYSDNIAIINKDSIINAYPLENIK